MKKGLLTILALFLVVSFVGCSASAETNDAIQKSPGEIVKNNDTVKPADQKVLDQNQNPSPNMGITVNTITFTQLKDAQIPESIQKAIEQHKQKRGYEFFLDGNGYKTLVVYSGEKTSGGYGIEVKSIEDNEGITNVVVEETEPPKGAMTITVMSYPYTVVKFTGTTDNFHVVNTSGVPFEAVN